MRKNYFKYRLYTEDVHSYKLENIVIGYFDAFTIFKTTGYYNGVKEPAVVIEVLTECDEEAKIIDLTNEIKATFKQEAVLYTEEILTGGLV